MDKTIKKQILDIFGYDPKSMNKRTHDNAMQHLFKYEHHNDPFLTVELFILNCTPEQFSKLKETLTAELDPS